MAYFQPSSNIHPGFSYKAPQKSESSSSTTGITPTAPQMDIPVEGISSDSFIRRTDVEGIRFRFSPEPELEPATATAPIPPGGGGSGGGTGGTLTILLAEHLSKLQESIKKRDTSEIMESCNALSSELQQLKSHKKAEQEKLRRSISTLEEQLKNKKESLQDKKKLVKGLALQVKSESEKAAALEKEGKKGTDEHSGIMDQGESLSHMFKMEKVKYEAKLNLIKNLENRLKQERAEALSNNENVKFLSALGKNVNHVLDDATKTNSTTPSFSELAKPLNSLQETLGSFRLASIVNPLVTLGVSGRQNNQESERSSETLLEDLAGWTD